jgi:5-methyltetrahydrofolate--homocysteine methyltransferase
MHTAVKIAPQYDNGVVHVLDASRSVTVVTNLLNKEQKEQLLNQVANEYDGLRNQFKNKNQKTLIKYEEAVALKEKLDWENYQPTKPAIDDVKVFKDFDLGTIAKYIDWGPFFIAWEMPGRFPEVLTDKIFGTEATRLYNDANNLLKKIVEEKWFTANGVIGFWQAQSNNRDTIILQTKEGEVHLESLRQQQKKAAGQSNFSLADFIKPGPSPTLPEGKSHQRTEQVLPLGKDLGWAGDYMGAFAVTIHNAKKHILKFAAENDDYNKILVQILADRFVEAFAECLHHEVRTKYWGYAKDESLSNEELIKEKYTGIRPAPGYPACPDHTEKIKLFKLLDVTNNIGIELTESLAMDPPASVCGWYFAHPQSHYFGLGKITRDQLEDYAKRKNMSIEEAEKWLSNNLE